MSKDFEQSLSQLGLLFNAIAENNHSFSSDIDCKYYNNLNEAIKIEHFYNAWFTQEQCIMACKAFGHMLSPSSIKKWLSGNEATA